MNNIVKIVIQSFIVEKRTLIKSIRIFKGAPSSIDVEPWSSKSKALLIHQCSVPKIA
jgi:hypothetical protein